MLNRHKSVFTLKKTYAISAQYRRL